MRKCLFSVWLCFAFTLNSSSQSVEKRVYDTKPIESNQAPKIDGVLDDESWESVEWSGDFIQFRPDEGKAPSQDTKFKITFDESNIYVAVKCFDPEPDKIEKQLSRRDGFRGDWIIVNFDSYHDLSTCFSFNVTAAGVKGDEVLTNDGNNSDSNWNPIWHTATKIDADGWSAEMKIPLSQLRFSAAESQVWGLQVMRKLFRKEERSLWQRKPADAAGWVSMFGELHGLKNIKPKRQVEIQPYTVAKVDFNEKQDGNPFATGRNTTLTTGVDGKIGLTNDITLDFTINPDFGQVEADPAQITLDGFQLFFREQRPFFVENQNIFSYGVSRSEAGNTFGNDNLFYSRRIGKNPSSYPSVNNGEFADVPNNTTILGAAKVSGKTQKGWSVGILESITANEYAEIDNNGESRQELVEPLTNYFVGRVSKEFNNRNTSIGGIVTSTNRKLDGQLDFLHKSAMTGGIDFKHYWKDRSWYLSGNAVFSDVKGSTNAITNTQTSIRHLFQREDASHLSVDTSRTSLGGSGGSMKIGKVGNGNFIFESGIAWRSPELEINDIGFQRGSDDIRHFNWMGYRWREPFGIFNNLSVNYNHWVVTDYEGNLNGVAFNVNSYANFKNNWYAGGGLNLTPLNYSKSTLRGGPRYRDPSNFNSWIWFDSDSRKKFRYGANINISKSEQDIQKGVYQGSFIGYRPTDAFEIRLNQNYNSTINQLQYVTQVENNGKTNYLMAKINQKTFSMSIRLNYTVNPNLSIQYYGQPFISRGRYTDFKWIKDPMAIDLASKVDIVSGDDLHFDSESNSYTINMSEDANTVNIGNPDFSFVQFRSNLVLRWEYVAGSELYFVWSQGTSGSADPRDGLLSSLNNQIFDNSVQNTFLVKATYRLVL